MAALDHVMQDVPVREMDAFPSGSFWRIWSGRAGSLCRKIDQTGQLSDEDIQSMLDLARTLSKSVS